MKISYRPRYVALAILSAGLIVSASASSKSSLVALDQDTFSVVRQAKTGLTRDTATLKAEALQDAASYCESHGKQLKVVSATEMKPLFMTADYARAKVVFKALNSDDPELKRETPAPRGYEPTTATANPVAASSAPALQGDLYSELIKLDELRQKGILTDDEFQSEKKKILKRSK